MKIRFTTMLLFALFSAQISTAWSSGNGPALELSAVIGGNPVEPVVMDSRVYLPVGRTVTTWDHADPAQPAHIATTEQFASGQIMALTHLGDYLYAGWSHADGISGVSVYSLDDPDNPEMINEFDDYTEGLRILRSVVAANDYLYIFDSEQGMFYSPVDNATHPGFTQVPGPLLMYDYVTAEGDYLYTHVTTLLGQAAIEVYDVSDPAAPTSISAVGGFNSTELFGVDVSPPLAGGFGEVLTLFDISDPSDIATRGQIASPPATQGVLVDGHAWSFGFDGIDVWDISDIDEPVAAGYTDIDLLGAHTVMQVGEYPVVTTRNDRVVALNAADPGNPAVTGDAYLPGGSSARDIAVADGVAIVLQEGYGFSIAEPDTLAQLGRFEADLPRQLNMRVFESFHIDDDRVYLAAWGYGVLIVDISDVMNPVEIGRYPYEYASEISAQGDFIYVGKATGGGELRIIDVSDPTQPEARGTLAVNAPRSLQVQGDHVYLADSLLGGLRIIDVSDPDHPVEVGLYDDECDYVGYNAYDLALDGAHAYLACHTGLHVVDVGDPQQPVRIGAYWRGPDVYSSRPRVDIHGDRAWYADASGVHEIDITDPTQPVLVSATPLVYSPVYRLRATDDGRLFAFAGPSGVHVFGSLSDEPPPQGDSIFSDRFEPPPPEPIVSDYDDVEEGFLGTEWNYQGIHYHDVNGVGGAFPGGDTFTAEDVGDQLIIERAGVFFDDFPDFGSAPNVLTFGTAFIPGDNLSLGAMVKVRMELEQPASAAGFDMAYFENGPWAGIVFNLEAYSGDDLVASDSLTIAGEDPDDRDNIAIASMSVSAPHFDSLYLYATYGEEFSAPRLIIDNLQLTPATGN